MLTGFCGRRRCLARPSRANRAADEELAESQSIKTASPQAQRPRRQNRRSRTEMDRSPFFQKKIRSNSVKQLFLLFVDEERDLVQVAIFARFSLSFVCVCVCVCVCVFLFLFFWPRWAVSVNHVGRAQSLEKPPPQKTSATRLSPNPLRIKQKAY